MSGGLADTDLFQLVMWKVVKPAMLITTQVITQQFKMRCCMDSQ